MSESQRIVEFYYKHARICFGTQEKCIENHEAYSRVLLALLQCSLKIQCLCNTAISKEQVFISGIKVKEIAYAQTCDISCMHCNSIRHVPDMSFVHYGAIMTQIDQLLRTYNSIPQTF